MEGDKDIRPHHANVNNWTLVFFTISIFGILSFPIKIINKWQHFTFMIISETTGNYKCHKKIVKAITQLPDAMKKYFALKPKSLKCMTWIRYNIIF